MWVPCDKEKMVSSNFGRAMKWAILEKWFIMERMTMLLSDFGSSITKSGEM